MEEQLKIDALNYHRLPRPGKISLAPTKPLANQRDLSLAYSPGVAYACTAIEQDPAQAAVLTSRANLVAVVTNGTAVLGLGDIGPLAGKPVMEGKGCLFKKFAGIDVFDIEIDETDPDKLVDIVASLEPTFGGINLEDIKAPECFIIERKLRERMNIPVFHDDQHGTAIIVAAAVLNGLAIVGKDIREVRLAGSGAGAAAIACLDLLVALGMRPEHITICDSKGVVRPGRGDTLDSSKARYARATDATTLAQIVAGADIFLGLSGPGVMDADMVRSMGAEPLILALANPEPEIRPELAKAARPDCIIGTGRSDYPNQVNNSLCFPFIFRGALDVGATTINEAMKLAAVTAIAELARVEQSEVSTAAYGAASPGFGPEYLIPRAFDPRLIVRIAPAVAQAAMDSGVATRPIADLAAYRSSLDQFVYHSGSTMRPVFDAVQSRRGTALKRVAYADGQDERVLRAAQIAVDEGLAHPVLIGEAAAIGSALERLGLRLRVGRDVDIVPPSSASTGKGDTGVGGTGVGARLLADGHADALLCGLEGGFSSHLHELRAQLGVLEGFQTLAALQMLILPERQIFICDTHVNAEPSPEQLCEMAILAAREVARFGLKPRLALLSNSNHGGSDSATSTRMRAALSLLRARAPSLCVDGDLRADAALSAQTRERELPDSRLDADANVLVMPNVEAANICYNALRIAAGNGITVGGILLGLARPAHVLSASTTVRRLVNMTALAAAQALA